MSESGKSNIEYDQSQLPLDSDSFARVLENVREGVFMAITELEYFEEAMARRNDSEMQKHSMICLEDFSELLEKIDTDIHHPSDLDKLFKDHAFREEFFIVVKGIKKYNFIGILEDVVKKEDLGSPDNNIILGVLRNHLKRAEYYRAAYGKSN
ncbi:MAG: hypothetical protein ABI430_01680 [Candidatus Taylorbacteria bacterium]